MDPDPPFPPAEIFVAGWKDQHKLHGDRGVRPSPAAALMESGITPHAEGGTPGSDSAASGSMELPSAEPDVDVCLLSAKHRAPPSLDELEAGNADRMMICVFGRAAQERWRKDRRIVMSEMTFRYAYTCGTALLLAQFKLPDTSFEMGCSSDLQS